MQSNVTITVLVLLATSAAALVAQADTPKLHPVKAVCIDYKSSGNMQQGTSTRCHREYGYEQYEIQNMTVGFGGFTQSQKQHSITIGNTIYVIDLSTKTGTKMTNPLYDEIVNATQDADPEEIGEKFIAAMGFAKTGATKNIAATSCNVYNSPMLGTVCLTDDGLMLEQAIMGNTTVATKVALGESGSDANYSLYKTVPITDGPDLSNMPSLQDLMNQGQQ